jgi:hypothetical protein
MNDDSKQISNAIAELKEYFHGGGNGDHAMADAALKVLGKANAKENRRIRLAAELFRAHRIADAEAALEALLDRRAR